MDSQRQDTAGAISILIADDAADIRATLKAVCSKLENVKIYEAANGEEAIEAAVKNRLDVVLMDLLMPVVDGFEATKQIKAMFPGTIILVITAVADRSMEHKVRRIGAAGYINKPITDIKRLRLMVSSFISYLLVTRYAARWEIKKGKNPFSKDIRAFKIVADITTENELMDFNLWLMEHYQIGQEKTNRFFLEAVKTSLKHHMPVTIWTEENFDWLFLCVAFYKPLQRAIGEEFKKDAVYDGNWLYIRLPITGAAESTPPPRSEPAPKVTVEVSPDSEERRMMLRQSHVEKVSASEYVSTLSNADIFEAHEMSEIEDEWSEILDDLAEALTVERMGRLGMSLSSYASTVNKLLEFSTLAYALIAMSKLLVDTSDEQIKNFSPPFFMTLMRGVLDDIKKWRNTIFVSRNTADIHYLDSSLLSSCMQIESLLIKESAHVEEESDLELF
ncbi:MAG: response regulator transcription factor [Helicobacteraceae bacterium]|jgi:two-component system chemotaxis response regulator CheY|nr:response regulator transcription factor [Helicobacteraceae bacterium]